MTRCEFENELINYSMCLPWGRWGRRTLFIRNGTNPIEKINKFELTYKNTLDIFDYQGMVSLEEFKNYKYRGIDFCINPNMSNKEMHVDVALWSGETYSGVISMDFYPILYERM